MKFDAEKVRATREELLLRLLFRATHAMNAEMADRIRRRGYADFQPSFTGLLAHIDTEGTRVVTIAKRTGTSRQAVSKMLQAIEARGYIECVADPEDGRAVIARHTADGRKLLLTAVEVMQTIEDEYEALLGSGKLARLKLLLKRLVASSDPTGLLGRQ